jgi:hypothetical protein
LCVCARACVCVCCGGGVLKNSLLTLLFLTHPACRSQI